MLTLVNSHEEYFSNFRDNLDKGIQYYKELFSTVKINLQDKKAKLIADLEKFEVQLKNLPVR